MTFIGLHILAILLSLASNRALLSDIEAALAADGVFVGQPHIIAELEGLAAVGAITWDAGIGEAVSVFADRAYVVPADANIDPNITAALQALADSIGSGGGASLASFLASVRSHGVDTGDAVAGLYVLREVAMISAAKLNDARLRRPIINAMKTLDVLMAALRDNPPAAA